MIMTLYNMKLCGLLVCATLLDLNVIRCNAFNVVPSFQVSRLTSSRLQSTAADYSFETEETPITFTQSGHVSRLSGPTPASIKEEVKALENNHEDDEEKESEEFDIEYLHENELKIKIVTPRPGVLSFSGTLGSPAEEEQPEEETESLVETISDELSDSEEVNMLEDDDEKMTTVANVKMDTSEDDDDEKMTTVADVSPEDIEASLEKASSAFVEAVALSESDVVLALTSENVAATEEEELESNDLHIEPQTVAVEEAIDAELDDIEEPSRYDTMKDEELRLEMEALAFEVEELKAEVDSLQIQKVEEQKWFNHEMRQLQDHEDHAISLRQHEASILFEKILAKESQIEVLEKERKSLRSLGRAAVSLVANRVKNILR